MSEASKGQVPLFVVISGPSGVGKDTVIREAMARDSRLARVVTVTTRQPRDAEVPWISYEFVSPEQFAWRVYRNDFLEHARVHGQRYGSPRGNVRRALGSGRDVLLQIDVQGARAIRAAVPGALLLFIAPDPTVDLDDWLRKRGTSEGTIARRRLDREAEMAAAPEFDHVIVNRKGEVSATVETFLELLERERARPERAPVEV